MATNKSCYMCKNFDRYYSKDIKRYNRTKFGLCLNKHENVNIHDTCDKFAIRKRPVGLKHSVNVCLNRLLTELTEIRRVLEDVDGEE